MVITKDFSAETLREAMQLMDEFFIENPYYRLLHHEIVEDRTVRVEYTVLQ
ncbi:hypothetical protein I593_02838 [Acinetobacter tandoii DSM 14970 = CIP 107469]|uniref:Uncharacterized protein n=1 Tax=Acinetobacter tandoii DSM 14970 = CIP 107469 TaxID=1120927 RepID=R9AVF1_9GAMM|nr:hypothetical protein I593_02838 [Acinetobacter tandoii DSM 14970 = CIP 107469]